MRFFDKIDQFLTLAGFKTLDNLIDGGLRLYERHLPAYERYREFHPNPDVINDSQQPKPRLRKIPRASLIHALHTPISAPVFGLLFCLKTFVEILESLVRFPYDFAIKKTTGNDKEFSLDKNRLFFGIPLLLVSILITAISPLIMIVGLTLRGAATIDAIISADARTDDQTPALQGSH